MILSAVITTFEDSVLIIMIVEGRVMVTILASESRGLGPSLASVTVLCFCARHLYSETWNYEWATANG